jgi:hypothetical protein
MSDVKKPDDDWLRSADHRGAPPPGKRNEVPCKVCDAPTTFTGTGLCDPCWALRNALDDGVRRGLLVRLPRGCLQMKTQLEAELDPP